MLVKSITVAVRSKVWVCGPSISRIAGWNPAESTDMSSVVGVVCCQGCGLHDELITRSEESCRLGVS